MILYIPENRNEIEEPAPKSGSAALMSIGGVLAALGATAVCAVPFALVMIGAGGAWIGRLRILEPYQPIFALVTLGFVAGGFYLVYRERGSSRLAKIGLWTATVLLVISVTFPVLAPQLF